MECHFDNELYQAIIRWQSKEGSAVPENWLTRDKVRELMTAVAAKDPSQTLDGLTPRSLMAARQVLADRDLPVQVCAFSADLWGTLISDTDFQRIVDPVSKYETLTCGILGSMYGLDLVSDSYEYAEDRIMPKLTVGVISLNPDHSIHRVHRANVNLNWKRPS